MTRRTPEDATALPVSTAAERDAALGPLDWSALPTGYDADVVAAPSGPLARIATGPEGAHRVILIPGMTGSKEDFLRMMPLLAEAGLRVESYDLAGQYQSAGAGPENLDPPQERYSLDLFVNDLLSVIGTGRAPVHVLGYSFAGTVAAVAALRQPADFASLTLLSSPPLPGQALRGFRVLGPLSWVVPARSLRRPFIAAVRSNIHRTTPDRAAFIRERFAHTRVASVGDILALMKRAPDVAAPLRNSGLPVLVVAGRGDVYPPALHRRFAERAGARFLPLATGHSPCETTPHQVAEAVLDLVSGR